ncbi:MAG: sigma-70 family RNA polymerase sigma factor [Myxococcota bacterium]
MSDADEDFAAWRRGDARAGERVLAPHYRSVLRFFELNASWAAPDLTQRTFEACIRQADALRSPGAIRAYLFGIARRQLAMHMRALPKVSTFEDDATRTTGHTRLSTLVGRRREHLLLLRVLAGLPKVSQLLLILHYWDQLSSAEVAKTLGIPAGTVRRKLGGARSLLRKRLELFDRRLPVTVGDDTQFAELMEMLVLREK